MGHFQDHRYGSFEGDWVNFFLDLGKQIAQNLTGNSRIVLLVPSVKVAPFLISLGACRHFLDSDISTGFYPIQEIWDELQSTEMGTEIHVIDKSYGFEVVKGKLTDLSKETFSIEISSQANAVKRAWMYNENITPNIDVSIVRGSNYKLPEKAKFEKGDPNLKLLGKFYEGLDPMGVLGLPNNLIQIVGNKNLLNEESNKVFYSEDVKGCFGDFVITKGSLTKERELTHICSTKEENLKKEANLSIFVNSKYTNILNLIDWTNNFPQVFIIPRTAPNIIEIVEAFNEEFFSKSEELLFDGLKIPVACDVMGYKV